MKRSILTLSLALAFYCANAQTNTFPSTGNVGIGTTSPVALLDVKGNIKVGGGEDNNTIIGFNVTDPNFSQNYIQGHNYLNLSTNAYSFGGTYNITNASNASWLVTMGACANCGGLKDNFTIYRAAETVSSPSFAPLFTINNVGNVGIGTAYPSTLLDVNGTGHFAGQINLDSDISYGNNTSFRIGNIGGTGGTGKLTLAGGHQGLDVYSGGNTIISSVGDVSFNYESNVLVSGKLGIGTTDPKGYKLAVNGNAIAESMTVKPHGNWPDYVFKKEYILPPLKDIKTYIDKNQHLPDMPSRAELAKNGVNLGEIVKVQTKKIEELTLYMIEKDKQVKDQDTRIKALEQALLKLTTKTKRIKR